MLPINTPAPAPDMLVTGHYRAQPTYEVYRRHGSGSWLLTYTLAGRGLFRQPGLELSSAPGDIVLLAPEALHDYSVPPGGAWEFVWAHFRPRMSWHSWWQLPAVGRGLFQVSLRTPALRQRARTAMLTLHADACAPGTLRRVEALTVPPYTNLGRGDDGAGPDALQSELALNGLETMLLLAVREGAHRIQCPLDARIQQVLDFIAEHPAAPHNLATLAMRVGLSPSRLAHLFKKEVGDTVTNTVISLRLRQAARLLEHTERSVAEVGDEVGFASPFYFSRQFHRHLGASPRAYRAARRAPPVLPRADR